MRFLSPYDIANRGLQHLGANLITTFADNSKNAAQANFVYDKARRAELRANPWNFSRRRAVLRASPTFLIQFSSWSISQAYTVGDIVSYNSGFWVAFVNNTGQTPLNGYPWSEYTGAISVPAYAAGAYYAGELIVSASTPFLSLTNNNTTAPPSTSWHPLLGATPHPLVLLSPLSYTTNLLPSSSRNLFALPPAYLRNMMQDPKAAGTPAQITTGGAQALDYEIEQGFLLSAAAGPIVFRYGADLQLVSWFDDLFCEALGARMGVELNETITQSPQKAQICNGLYEEAIAKAVRVNAIEAGSTEPDGDKVDSQRGPTREKVLQPQRPQQ